VRADPGAADVARERSHQDPLAADRRTLVIAAVAMVALISVGVVSAALFTGSACDDLAPGEVAVAAASSDVRQVVDEAFGELDEDGRDAIVDDVSELASQLGPVTGAAQVGPAERMAAMGAGAVAVGPATPRG
jgi:hypothetical protein